MEGGNGNRKGKREQLDDKEHMEGEKRGAAAGARGVEAGMAGAGTGTGTGAGIGAGVGGLSLVDQQ